jgi:UDP-3-O-[3-hydroxymyristoyl] N-acetylglucosamine deacetylase/3-hydroxyacyl-[acyl-carrier-protein] dehydratase
MEKQKTLKSSISFSGVGLHTGAKVNITVLPAVDHHGYKFQRIDLPNSPIIPATLNYVNYTVRGTVLEKDGVKVSTTEHLLAALYGMQIDNALIEIDGPEVPILDGSALMYVKAIEAAGIVEQEAIREYFELEENIKFEIPDKGIEFLAVPDKEFRVTVMVDYNSPILGTQHAQMMHMGEFKKEIAHCRTFVFLKELEQLANLGLIKGGDLDNAIVLVDRENVTPEELRDLAHKLGRDEHLDVHYKGIGLLNNSELRELNEPARHKLLDIVGDLALIGRPIKAHILAARPGHYGNTEFGKVLLEQFKKQKKNYKHFNISHKPVYDINDIQRMLPHRFPFLLVDKILEVHENRIVGIKNVTIDEPFFTGHFPENPIMPGVLQVEAMAQVGGMFALNKVENPEDYTTYFLRIDHVKFRKKVIPGDVLVFDLELISPIRKGIVHMAGKAYVNNELVSEAELVAQIVKEK